jgi:hypothetical protein
VSRSKRHRANAGKKSRRSIAVPHRFVAEIQAELLIKFQEWNRQWFDRIKLHAGSSFDDYRTDATGDQSGNDNYRGR